MKIFIGSLFLIYTQNQYLIYLYPNCNLKEFEFVSLSSICVYNKHIPLNKSFFINKNLSSFHINNNIFQLYLGKIKKIYISVQ